jgi:bifunctional DNA-binding transcriptional regulator/antitoxin component of YhaV-PrlF toxin-antitoxin module
MPNKVLEIGEGFFLLKIAKNKRVTLPDEMMTHMDLKEKDMIMLKLVEDGIAHVKKFDSVTIQF